MKLPILVTMACVSAFGVDNSLSPAEKKGGFELLFDGRSFNGWRDPATEQPPGDSWVIEAGTLKTVATPHIREDLITRQSYGDFELKFDWRISPRGNTGVKYRIQGTAFIDNSKVNRKTDAFEATVERGHTAPLSTRTTLTANATAQEYTIAYEFQLIDDKAYPEDLHSAQITGSLYSMIPAKRQAAHTPGEWNESRLIVKGDHFEHWINGVKVLDGSLNSKEALAETAKRWAKAPTIQRILTNPRPSGPISLQHHGGAVWFKNLKIRPL